MKQRKKAFFDRSEVYLRQLAEDIQGNNTEKIKQLMTFYSTKVANWSSANILGIYLQKPKISRPVTIREAKALGHKIKKGIQCAEILVPCVARPKRDSEEEGKAIDKQGDREYQDRPATIERPDSESPEEDEFSRREREDHQTRRREADAAPPTRVFFKLVACVVDLGVDTDGPLQVTSSSDEEADLIIGAAMQYADSKGFVVSTEGSIALLSKQGLAGGVAYTTPGGSQEIALGTGAGAARRLSTLIHEMAHHMLGHTAEHNTTIPRRTMETQAEAVAYCVCQHFGIHSEYAGAYLQGWGTNPKDLMDNLRVISKVSREIINGIQRQINIGVDIDEEEPEIIEVDEAEFEGEFLGDTVTVWHRRDLDFVPPEEFDQSLYEKVAIITNTNLSDAFGLTQHIDSRWTSSTDERIEVLTKKARSSSVGDVLELGNGDYRAVSPLGFSPIPAVDEAVQV